VFRDTLDTYGIQLAQARYQVTDNAKNMITAFDMFSLTASTVYLEDELKVVNDEIVETNIESEVAEFVNDSDDYISKPPYIEIPSVRHLPCTAHTLGLILITQSITASRQLFLSFSVTEH